MRGVFLVFLIALIPALAALGHDIYLFYEYHGVNSVQHDIEQQIEDKGPLSFFAALGFIWTRYSPDTYKVVADSVDEETWAHINLLLTQKAFFLGLVFAGLVAMLAFILRLLGVGSGESGGKGFGRKGAGDELSLLSRNRDGRMKYKRK